MKYRKELMHFIKENDDRKMMNWIQSQPLIEQPDIFRELKEIAEEIAKEHGKDLSEIVEGYEDYDAQIHKYEEAILDEKLAEVQLNMALDERDKAMAEMFERVEMMKEYVIECIATNAPNAAEMKKLAEHIIVFEKDAGIYDPETWKIIGL